MALIRIGFGYDVHQLAEGLPLILGGIPVPHSKGIVAHSDGDVLLHAISDALLGSLALGDIGTHFPDTDIKWKDADSKVILAACADMIRKAGYTINNIDTTLRLEKPKIKSLVPKMQEEIAKTLLIDKSAVSIKATTEEKMGFVGREEGIAAYAVVLVEKTRS